MKKDKSFEHKLSEALWLTTVEKKALEEFSKFLDEFQTKYAAKGGMQKVDHVRDAIKKAGGVVDDGTTIWTGGGG